MATLPKEHSKVYFDTLCRTKKMETVLSLIKATFNAYKTKNVNVKEEIAHRLKAAYELLKIGNNGSGSGAGTYSGSTSQFESQYTIGHEMGIWHDSDLHLTFEAMLVACDFITIKDYFDLVFKNYVQLIDGKVYHPLYGILKYMIDNNTSYIQVSKIAEVFDGKCDDEQCRSIANFLIGTSYFELSTIGRETKLRYVSNDIEKQDLFKLCNITYLTSDGYTRIKNELNDSLSYENYLFSRRNEGLLFEGKTKDEVRALFRNWLKSNLNQFSSTGHNGYDSMLFQIFDILESSGIVNKDIYRNSGKLYYQIIRELYLENSDAMARDDSQNNPGRAAFPFYSDFVSQICLYGWDEVSRGVVNNLSTSDLIPLIKEEADENQVVQIKEQCNYSFRNKDGQNLIVYGTPGCGKSYYVQHTLLYKGGYRFDDNGINCLDAIRTTFFQDYTNTDFVGQIMPVVNADKSVTYEFNPGPFTLALNKAIQNPDKPIALVIEELNRGNAASIFGDIFQLLDRDNGTSIYNITNVNIQKYLEEQNPTMKFDYIKLPSNLSIFATMNTSDQNVFTLDTAFKRRWKFEKIKNTFLEDHKFKGSFIPGMDMDWEEFCNSINEFIVNDKNFINSEDKQLGVYFVDEKGLRKVQGDGSTEESRKEFAYKIFEYLWDDVAKYDREKWFNNIKTLDTLIDKYVDEGADDKSGINVFSDGIFKKK